VTAVNDPLQALLAAGLLPTTSYPPGSRYLGTPILSYQSGDGRDPVRYLRRRLVPAPESMALLGYHSVVAGDRLDLISHAAFSDAQLWWRIADANTCVDPAELTEKIGRRLRITLPPGTPGAADG